MQLTGLISLMVAAPLLGALIVILLPGTTATAEGSEQSVVGGVQRMLLCGTALITGLLAFLCAVGMMAFYATHSQAYMQFNEKLHWIPLGNGQWVNYHMGIDGISLLLTLLSTFVISLTLLYATRSNERLKERLALLLLLESALVGVYCAQNLVLFYLFFEASLIPTYLLVGMFGGARRASAAIRFFLYTFVGSVLMLLAIVALYHYTGTFNIAALSSSSSAAGIALRHLPSQALFWMFAAFALAFSIKTALFPFHSWLPDAYAEAPVVGSVALVLLKMGIYGFVRIAIPIFPQQAQNMAPLFIVLAVCSIIYGSLVAAVQTDARRVIAFSSVAHLGFVVLGIFTFTRIGMMGALLQNFNHGIFTPMLFLLLGMLTERRGSTDIADFGGVKKVLPMLSTMMLIATLGSIAVPFFSGFAGEFPVLLGSWVSSISHSVGGYWPTALAAAGTILAAVYMLWWYQRIMLGPVRFEEIRKMPDLNRTEWAVVLPLACLIFWVGLGSGFFTRRMNQAVNRLVPYYREQIDSSLPVSAMVSDEREVEEKQVRMNLRNHALLITSPDAPAPALQGAHFSPPPILKGIPVRGYHPRRMPIPAGMGGPASKPSGVSNRSLPMQHGKPGGAAGAASHRPSAPAHAVPANPNAPVMQSGAGEKHP